MLYSCNCALIKSLRSASAFPFQMSVVLLLTFACSQIVAAQSSNRGANNQTQQQRYQGQANQGQQQYQNQQRQAGGQNQQSQAAQYQQRQSNSAVQLTPEQRAAQQRAAMQSPANQRAAQEAYAAQMQKKIVQPAGFPLTPEHTKYVSDLLSYWETNSNAVSKYKCNFRRFEYDPGVVKYRDPQNNQLAAHTVAFGEIRFASPDRARYETTRIMEFTGPPQQAGGQAKYDPVDGDMHLERWICDGKSIYEFDFELKRIYDTKLPREIQGNVAESPIYLWR